MGTVHLQLVYGGHAGGRHGLREGRRVDIDAIIVLSACILALCAHVLCHCCPIAQPCHVNAFQQQQLLICLCIAGQNTSFRAALIN